MVVSLAVFCFPKEKSFATFAFRCVSNERRERENKNAKAKFQDLNSTIYQFGSGKNANRLQASTSHLAKEEEEKKRVKEKKNFPG